jgi:hypothetical protein
MEMAHGGVMQEIPAELAWCTWVLAEHEVDRAIQRVVKDQGIDVDCGHVHNKYLGEIIKEMKASTCAVGNLDTMLLSVCEKYCYEMLRQPVDRYALRYKKACTKPLLFPVFQATATPSPGKRGKEIFGGVSCSQKT